MAPAGAFVAVVVTSSERLAEIQARREKITRSPWHIEMHYDDVIDEMQPIICAPNPVGTPRNGIVEVFFGDRVLADAEFIAAAPADVDWLIAEVERLQSENRALSTTVDETFAEAESERATAEARVETLQRQVEGARTEWGVRLTWPDGVTDVQKRESQDDAERMADWHSGDRSVCTAEVITRTVAVSDWSPAAAAVPGKPQPTQPEGDHR